MSTDARAYEYGRIVSVDVRTLGDNLDADTLAGASTLVVEGAADFDETGGQLLLGGVVYTYTAVDDETGTITLSTTTSADAFEGDAVHIYDPTYLAASTEKVAQVEVIGDDGNVDTLECLIAMHLVDKLDDGVRGARGESVQVEIDGDSDWVVVDIQGLGNPNSSGTLFMQDTFVVTATGDQAFTLTYEPIVHSEHFYWHPNGEAGIYQSGTEWTRDGRVITATDPGSIVAVGDKFTVEYAYRTGFISADILPVPYESDGWRFLLVSEGDATDRSGSGVDDSAWSEATGPFGFPLTEVPTTDWPTAVTSTVSEDSGFWLRRRLTVAPGSSITVAARVDGNARLFANGALIGSSASGVVEIGPFTVVATVADMVIALHVDDDATDPFGDWLYGDVSIEES